MGLLDVIEKSLASSNKIVDAETQKAARDMNAKLDALDFNNERKLRVMAVFLAEAAKLMGMPRELALEGIAVNLRKLK